MWLTGWPCHGSFVPRLFHSLFAQFQCGRDSGRECQCTLEEKKGITSIHMGFQCIAACPVCTEVVGIPSMLYIVANHTKKSSEGPIQTVTHMCNTPMTSPLANRLGLCSSLFCPFCGFGLRSSGEWCNSAFVRLIQVVTLEGGHDLGIRSEMWSPSGQSDLDFPRCWYYTDGQGWFTWKFVSKWRRNIFDNIAAAEGLVSVLT